jgi:hypothetical protein
MMGYAVYAINAIDREQFFVIWQVESVKPSKRIIFSGCMLRKISQTILPVELALKTVCDRE